LKTQCSTQNIIIYRRPILEIGTVIWQITLLILLYLVFIWRKASCCLLGVSHVVNIYQPPPEGITGKSNIPPFYLHYHNFHTPIIDVTKWASVYEETLPQSLPIYRPIWGIIRRLLLNLIAVASISRLSAVSRRL